MIPCDLKKTIGEKIDVVVNGEVETATKILAQL